MFIMGCTFGDTRSLVSGFYVLFACIMYQYVTSEPLAILYEPLHTRYPKPVNFMRNVWFKCPSLVPLMCFAVFMSCRDIRVDNSMEHSYSMIVSAFSSTVFPIFTHYPNWRMSYCVVAIFTKQSPNCLYVSSLHHKNHFGKSTIDISTSSVGDRTCMMRAAESLGTNPPVYHTGFWDTIGDMVRIEYPPWMLWRNEISGIIERQLIATFLAFLFCMSVLPIYIPTTRPRRRTKFMNFVHDICYIWMISFVVAKLFVQNNMISTIQKSMNIDQLHYFFDAGFDREFREQVFVFGSDPNFVFAIFMFCYVWRNLLGTNPRQPMSFLSCFVMDTVEFLQEVHTGKSTPRHSRSRFFDKEEDFGPVPAGHTNQGIPVVQAFPVPPVVAGARSVPVVQAVPVPRRSSRLRR
jgi:hypothetical protein